MAEETEEQRNLRMFQELHSMMKDVHWQVSTDQGREYLAELIGGRGASKTLNTPIQRQGAMKDRGPVTAGQVFAWHDDGTLQILAAVRALLEALPVSGTVNVDEIRAALREELETAVVQVDVSVGAKPAQADGEVK